MLASSRSTHAPFGTLPPHVSTFQDDYEEVGPLYACSLAIHENAVDPCHPDVATMLDNRARLLIHCSSAINFAFLDAHVALSFSFRGKVADAGHMYLQAIEIGEKALGLEHRDLADGSTTRRSY